MSKPTPEEIVFEFEMLLNNRTPFTVADFPEHLEMLLEHYKELAAELTELVEKQKQANEEAQKRTSLQYLYDRIEELEKSVQNKEYQNEKLWVVILTLHGLIPGNLTFVNPQQTVEEMRRYLEQLVAERDTAIGKGNESE